MPILQFEQVFNEPKSNVRKTNVIEDCIVLDSFQDQFLSRNWDVAMRLLQKHHFITERSNMFNELPLHTALWINAPEDIVLFIIAQNENAVFNENAKKQYPIHLAVKYLSSLKVIEALIRKCPHALEKKDNMKMTPRDYGRNHGEQVNNLLRLPTSFWISL